MIILQYSDNKADSEAQEDDDNFIDFRQQRHAKLSRNLIIFAFHFVVPRAVASSFIAADLDACIDALESIFGKRHR